MDAKHIRITLVTTIEPSDADVKGRTKLKKRLLADAISLERLAHMQHILSAFFIL